MDVDVVLMTKTCLSGNISDQKLLVTLLQLDLHFTTQKKVCVDCRDGRWGGVDCVSSPFRFLFLECLKLICTIMARYAQSCQLTF